jgi:5-hydroxyisourate hydrolase
MSGLTTHVLDTAHGRPAAGMAVLLYVAGALHARGETNADGRCPGLMAGDAGPGRYAIEFGVADYFRGCGVVLPEPPFLDVVRIEFGIAEAGGHYHVPLLVSPFGYSTYRGS